MGFLLLKTRNSEITFQLKCAPATVNVFFVDVIPKKLYCEHGADRDLRSLGRQSDRMLNKISTLIDKTIKCNHEHAYEH